MTIAEKLHLVALAIWAVLMVPTVLLWRDSVAWISLMSIYAILASHAAAYEAARAERAVKE